MGCCSTIYIFCCVLSLVLFYFYKDGIEENCDKDLMNWWIWSLILNFFPPVVGLILFLLSVCTRTLNHITIKKHNESEVIEESVKIWSSFYIFMFMLFCSITILVILATYIWLIVGTVWVAQHTSCLNTDIYSITIFWIIVQYLYVTYRSKRKSIHHRGQHINFKLIANNERLGHVYSRKLYSPITVCFSCIYYSSVM